MQTSTLFEENGRLSFFYEIEVYVVTNQSTWLDKHQTIDILFRVEFLRIFRDFSSFLKFISTSC